MALTLAEMFEKRFEEFAWKFLQNDPEFADFRNEYDLNKFGIKVKVDFYRKEEEEGK